MRVLFDQGTPVPLRGFLIGHEVVTAFEVGWSEISNSELLEKAKKEFDVLLTTDKQLKYQQDLASRRIAIPVLPYASWIKLRTHAEKIASAVMAVKPGSYGELRLD
jgi:uncharacterized protein DUF5615